MLYNLCVMHKQIRMLLWENSLVYIKQQLD